MRYRDNKREFDRKTDKKFGRDKAVAGKRDTRRTAPDSRTFAKGGKTDPTPKRAAKSAPAVFDDGGDMRDELIYGKNAVTELLKSGKGVDTVFIADNVNESLAAFYTALAKECGAVAKVIHQNKMNAMCHDGNHQGVAAYRSTVEYCSVEDILKAAEDRGEPPFVVLCDGIEDPHNLGAIMRSAYLMGAHGIVIPKRGGVSVTSVVHKTSAGASMHLPVAKVANIARTVRLLKEKNIFVYCADMNARPLYDHNLTGAIALVVGSEGKGVQPLVKSLCDDVVSIPMSNRGTGVDSFNASVAAGIIMYEIRRQRTKNQ